MTHINTIIGADKRYKEAISVFENLKNIQDSKEREKENDRANRLIVSLVYDKAEMYEAIAFQLISAADIMLRTSADLISLAEPQARYKDKFLLSKAKQSLNKIMRDFEQESIRINEEYFKHGYTENSELNVFDAIDGNSRLVLRFLMLFYNSLTQSEKNANLIEAYLRRIKGAKPPFSIEEIDSFKTNK